MRSVFTLLLLLLVATATAQASTSTSGTPVASTPAPQPTNFCTLQKFKFFCDLWIWCAWDDGKCHSAIQPSPTTTATRLSECE